MKATLRFDLPKERADYQDALDGAAMRRVLRAYLAWMRGQIKHQTRPGWETIQECRERLFAELDAQDVRLG